nr:hypothetical protein [Tanacetum cinerariifolium]
MMNLEKNLELNHLEKNNLMKNDRQHVSQQAAKQVTVQPSSLQSSYVSARNGYDKNETKSEQKRTKPGTKRKA